MRPYLTARSLGLLVVALLLMSVMAALGLWQLGAYDDHQHDDAEAAGRRPAVALDTALGPDESFAGDSVGRPVTATGRYLAAEQFSLRGYAGADGRLVAVTPLLTPSGSAILVLRGVVDAGSPPPAGAVEVEGVLEPSDVTGSALDESRSTDGIRISSLVQDIDHDLYAGYVVLRASTPADTLAPVQAPLSEPSRWAGIRNLAYALQWWLFAGFVAFMWWRIVNEGAASPSQPVG